MLTLAQTGVPFVWLGAVLSISFLEAPLKFRAPGVTVALGVGIGRLVFRALNRVELALAALLLTAVLAGPTPSAGARVACLAATAVLLAQTLWLRPRMDRRAQLLLEGQVTGRSRLHLVYVLLEVAKAAVLAWAGIALTAGLLP